MNRRILGLGAALVFAGMGFGRSALACNRTPFSDAWNWGGSTTWEARAGECDLRVQVDAVTATAPASEPMSAAVSYMRREPTAPLRLRFTVDSPTLSTLTGASRYVSLARGVARQVNPSSTPGLPVFDLRLFGGSGQTHTLLLRGWCAAEATHLCLSSTYVSAPFFPLDIAITVEVGAGAAGRIRLWVNADPDTAVPTLELNDLDNAATDGIHRTLIGLFDGSTQFNQTAGGHAFLFQKIQARDDQLFWNSFERFVAGSVETNRERLYEFHSFDSSTTCDGSNQLPQVAHGTTSLWGTVAIHPVRVRDRYASFDLQAPAGVRLAMFLCPLGAGPADRCLASAAGTGRVGLVTYDLEPPGVEPGDYQLVIGSPTTSTCSSYDIFMRESLND